MTMGYLTVSGNIAEMKLLLATDFRSSSVNFAIESVTEWFMLWPLLGEYFPLGSMPLGRVSPMRLRSW